MTPDLFGTVLSELPISKELRERQDRCALVRHPDHFLARIRFGNGVEHYGFWCRLCYRSVTVDLGINKGPYITAEVAQQYLAPDATLADLPLVQPNLRLRVCFYCGQVAPCEDDHALERAIHFELAEQGPIVPACRVCHDKKTDNLRRFRERLGRPERGAA